MKGKHNIILETGHVRYEFEIKRNITVIQGDSATGKTTMLDLLRQYYQRGKGSGVVLQSDKKCVVFGGSNDSWKPIIEAENDCIVFIDEDYTFIYSKEFAEVVRESDNYYVLITRKPLKNLPYSVNEIYGIKTSGKYNFPQKTYNELYRIYSDETVAKSLETIIITEDSNSGFQFFKAIAKTKECISSDGNANISNVLIESDKEKSCLVIADGAAFGSLIEQVLSVARLRNNVSVYLPESFEWLVLESGLITDKEVEQVLEAPWDYIDSKEFFSWERFFYAVLEKSTRENKYMHYSKDELPEYYLQEKNSKKILAVIPDEISELIQ